MSPTSPKARLVCESGDLAGTSFELGAETTIGTKKGHDIVLESEDIAANHARIRFQDGDYFLEDLGSPEGIRLDGAPLERRTQLGRLHVIELSRTLEFVFIQEEPAGEKRPSPTEARPDAEGAEEAAEPKETPDAPPEQPEGPDPSHTIVDMEGFGTLPERFRPGSEESARGEEKGAAEGPDEPEPEPPDRAGSPDPSHTVVDMEGFGALPEKFRPGAKEPAGEEEPAPPDAEADADETVVSPRMSKKEPLRRFGLEVALPDGGAQTFPLEPGENVVGRGKACDIALPDPEKWLSRKHAMIRVQGDSVELVDLESLNGTLIDGERIERANLDPGSTFTLGPHLTFTLREL